MLPKVWNAEKNECVCPSSQPYDDGEKCLACERQIWNPETLKCEDCPESAPLFNNGKCEACKSGTHYNATTFECVSCPSNKVYDSNSKECACPADKPHFNNELCLACPERQMWDKETL